MYVRNKRTGATEIRRAGDFSKVCTAAPSSRSLHLHYTTKSKTDVCRCNNANRHEKPSPVVTDSSSKYLVAGLTRYLDMNNVDVCSVRDYNDFTQHVKEAYARDAVYLDDFHYATRQKDVVCRCTKPNNHGNGPVRNPEIVARCAEFFGKNKDKATCPKASWRSFDSESSSDGSCSPPPEEEY